MNESTCEEWNAIALSLSLIVNGIITAISATLACNFIFRSVLWLRNPSTKARPLIIIVTAGCSALAVLTSIAELFSAVGCIGSSDNIMEASNICFFVTYPSAAMLFLFELVYRLKIAFHKTRYAPSTLTMTVIRFFYFIVLCLAIAIVCIAIVNTNSNEFDHVFRTVLGVMYGLFYSLYITVVFALFARPFFAIAVGVSVSSKIGISATLSPHAIEVVRVIAKISLLVGVILFISIIAHFLLAICKYTYFIHNIYISFVSDNCTQSMDVSILGTKIV